MLGSTKNNQSFSSEILCLTSVTFSATLLALRHRPRYNDSISWLRDLQTSATQKETFDVLIITSALQSEDTALFRLSIRCTMSDRDDQTTSEAATEPSRQQHSKASGRTNDIQLVESQIAITKEHVISYADLIHNTWNSLDVTLLPARFYLGALYFMTMSTARLLGVHEVLEKFP